jgi:Vitamin K-dependent gamma-carboxylase
VSDAVAAWERFWFKPEPTSTLAIVRIWFGLFVFIWAATLGHDLTSFFGPHGVTPVPNYAIDDARGIWSPLSTFNTDFAVHFAWVLLMVAALSLAAGFHSRLSAVLVFAGVLTFERRNPWIFNAGDNLLRVLAFYMTLAPSGAALSVDRWRKHRDAFWEFPMRAPIAVRLIQLQLSIVYFFAVWSKVRGVTWNDGTAVSYAFRLEDLQRFAVPHWLMDSVFAANVFTYGTLMIELGVAFAIWNKALRPVAVAAGLSLHLGIDYAIRVGFFTWAILTPYLAFVNPYWAEERLLALRDRLEARRLKAPLIAPQAPARPAPAREKVT